VANLMPAMSLLLARRSKPIRRCIRTGPHMAAIVGRTTNRIAAIHSGSPDKKSDTLVPFGARMCGQMRSEPNLAFNGLLEQGRTVAFVE
jgi:hypothetical protein